MLIALGNIDMNSLIDGIISMAENQNMIHEHNQETSPGSYKHPDGWGIAYLENEKWVVEKSIKPIYQDEKINNFRDLKTNLVILHARRKSQNTEISNENCHPFKHQDFVFCHHGDVLGQINYSPSFELKGQTDSEKLFYSILTDLKKSLPEAVKTNIQKYPSECSNIILSTKEKSFVIMKESKRPLYSQMSLGKNKDSLILSSEELPNLKDISWQKLDFEKVYVVDNNSLDISAQ